MQHWQAKSWSPAPRSPTEPLAGSPAWAHTAQRPAATERWLEAIFIYQQDTFSQCLVGSEKLCVNVMDCLCVGLGLYASEDLQKETLLTSEKQNCE